MKHLILLRHATAENPGNQTDDFDRRLTPRGKAESSLSGTGIMDVLSQYSIKAPEIIFSSPSRRTDETVRIVQTKLNTNSGLPVKLIYFRELYLPSLEDLLNTVWSGDDADSVLICSHNPGISILANHLFGDELYPLPPGGFVVGSFDCSAWPKADIQNSRLVRTGGP